MADTIVVASSAWNLSGDWLNRIDFRKSAIMGNMTQKHNGSMGAILPRSYKDSCALRMRQFLKWSKIDGDFQWYIGMTNGKMPGEQLNLTLIRNNIPLDPEYSINQINFAEIGYGTVAYFVRAYMNENYRGLTFSWTYDRSTNTVTCIMDGTGDIVTFNPVNFDENALYLYVEYMRDDFTIWWYIYRRYTGNPALDTQFLLVNPVMLGTFYPPIPFRLDNVAVDEGDERYPLCKKAFRKAFGGDFDKVQEKILDNASIDDIDFVYATFAVALNTKDRSSKLYIYRFLEYLLHNTNNMSAADEAQWLSDWDEDVSRPPIPWKELQWSSIRTGVGMFRTALKWAFLHEEFGTGTGPGKPNAKQGDIWWTTTIRPLLNYPPDENDGFNQRVRLTWQTSPNTWRRLTIIGFQYNNWVYRTTQTMTRAIDAILDTTKESSFLVPMHEVLFEDLPTLDKIQVSLNCNFLVFNCYIVDEQEWYESDWFKGLVIVVIVAVSVVAAVFTGGNSLGVGGAAIAGLLGGAGLSAAAALIIAAAVEALAGILIAFLITEVSTALFGEEWGPIIGAILSFVVSFGMSAGSISEAINALSKPDVWIGLATATGNAASAYMQSQAMQIAEDTAKMLEEYSQQTAEVQRQYQELMAGNPNGVDLGVLNRYIQETSEKPSDFFKRTLATGSDVVEITLKQIEDFAKINLQSTLA